MEESEKHEKEKKTVYEIATFPVPYSLKDINKNLTIDKNITSTPSKEKILNQAPYSLFMRRSYIN